MNVIVYSRPGCVQCDATKRELDKAGIAYQALTLDDHPEIIATMQENGIRSLPFVTAGDAHWGGFDPDRIKQLAA